MNGYIGSVRFFKNLILLAVIVCIAVPSVSAARLNKQVAALEGQVGSLEAQVGSLESANAQQQELIRQQQAELDGRGLANDGSPYQALYPDFYAPQPLAAKTRHANTVYLTFDDGPSGRTPEVLEILRQENVKATFFVIGQSSEQAKQWMRDIVSEGHTIGMHTYTHNYYTIYDSVEAYLDDMYRVFNLIRETTGVTPTVFRLPGGSINGYNHEVYQEILSEMLRRGFVPYDWNVSSGDAASTAATAAQITDNVLSGASGLSRAVVLMHDAAPKYSTVQALQPMIAGLRSMGFKFDCLHPDTAPIVWAYDY